MMQNIVVLLWNLFIWYTVSGKYVTSISIFLTKNILFEDNRKIK